MVKEPDILIAGGSGFVGCQLAQRLLTDHQRIRCVSRHPSKRTNKEISILGDLADPDFARQALEGIDTAYYLIHSLDSGEDRFKDRDRAIAENFISAADACGLRRIIYLSGLGHRSQALSDHLNSRDEVGRILSSGRPDTSILRAAVIVGAGGTSFEMLRFIVQTQLVIPDIPWLETRCQPIALKNVVHYLAGCLHEQRTSGESYDIGGPEVLTYRQMLDEIAKSTNTLNLYFPVPWYSPKLIAAVIGLFSRINGDVALSLLRSIQHEVVCRDNRIQEVLPQPLLPFADAVRLALSDSSSRGC